MHPEGGSTNQSTAPPDHHHCSMFLLWWIGSAYMAGGAAVPCTVINSSIHVVMYWEGSFIIGSIIEVVFES